MTDELLAQLRRTTAPASATPDEYQAFAGKNTTEFLDIRPVKPPYQSPRCEHLVNVAHDGPEGTNFLITYTTMSVLAKGRNLQQVVSAIQHKRAVYIQEFDPEKWPPPPDDKTPVIENLLIHFHGNALATNLGQSANR